MPLSGTGFHALRRAELQDAVERVKAVAAHITDRAGSEVKPAAPYKRKVSMIKGPFRGRAQPQVPVKSVRNRIGLRGSFDSLRPERTARPIVNFPHSPNHSRGNPLGQNPARVGSFVGDGDLRRDRKSVV